MHSIQWICISTFHLIGTLSYLRDYMNIVYCLSASIQRLPGDKRNAHPVEKLAEMVQRLTLETNIEQFKSHL